MGSTYCILPILRQFYVSIASYTFNFNVALMLYIYCNKGMILLELVQSWQYAGGFSLFPASHF